MACEAWPITPKRARFELVFDELVAEAAGTSGVVAVDAWTRVESAACARRLAAMVDMLDAAHSVDGSANRDQWCLDNWAAVCAHIGAAQRLTSGAASGLLLIGTALRDRFPKVGAVFAAGLIGYSLARVIVSRGALVKNPDALRALDTALARALRSWEPSSQDKTAQAVDAFVARFDPHAVRRTQTGARSRSVEVVFDDGSGLAEVFCTLFAPDAAAFDGRLDAFADTVCPADPRTRDQRRADAVGAMAHGADRLPCSCTTANCTAATTAPSTAVIVHVIAAADTVTQPTQPKDPPPAEDTGDPRTDDARDERARLDGSPPPMFCTPLRELTLTEALTDTDPGALSGIRPAIVVGGPFLPGAIARRAALTATVTTIAHPGLAPPEPRYTPSRKLADFVRCRDVTCRFPGCRVPATNCDLDHTIPWPHGPTSASNLSCLCRRHHLLKTFWVGGVGWRIHQAPNGTLLWTAPDGSGYTTVPGSRLLFPELSEPTAPVTVTDVPNQPSPAAELAMPHRTSTRARDRARRIDHERQLNQAAAGADPTSARAVGR